MRRTSWIVLWLAFAAAAAVAAQLGVRWNVSPSVTPGLYLARHRAPVRGELVLVCLPATVGRWAHLRGYLPQGHCEGGSQPLGKWIVGVGGDRIEIHAEAIAVNGIPLDGSHREPTDVHDRPMPLAPEGVWLLGPGEVWLHSGRHPRSLDSRVYGPLDASTIQAVLEPLWTVPEP